MKQKQKAIVIGSGIGGLGVAALLAQDGYEVQIFEKNEQVGGRMSVFEADGFRFDMGPSWYLMPEVFARFFSLLGERIEDYLTLKKLTPSYRIFFKDTGRVEDFYSDINRDKQTFDRIESGAGASLEAYLKQSKIAYDISMQEFLYKNYDSIFDFFTWNMMTKGRKLSVFSSMHAYVSRYFSNEYLQKVIEYQLVFLGSSPYNTPSLYRLMNHIDFDLGVFYPEGGIYAVIQALAKIARARGVEIMTDMPVHQIRVEQGRATGVLLANGSFVEADLVISNADYAFTEKHLLDKKDRTYSDAYWDSRVMAPSAFILYLGIKGRIPSLQHHSLIFSKDWKQNFKEIFDDPRWPSDPSLYLCAPSVTDPTVAPPDHENVFILVPIPSGLSYTPADLAHYEDKILRTMSEVCQIPDLQERIVFKKSFSVKDFEERYNAFKGTALGFAHTLTQTAIFRPNNISKKVKGLYYVGAGTNPGIGMPICLISAELAWQRIHPPTAKSEPRS